MLDDHEELGRISVDHVESYPQDATGRKVSGSLLYNATPAVLESQGFKRLRRSGKHNWVVRTVASLSSLNAVAPVLAQADSAPTSSARVTAANR